MMSDGAATSTSPRYHRKRWLLGIVAAACLVATSAFSYCWQLATTAVAPARCVVGAPPDDYPCESITLESRSGAKIAAWYAGANLAAESRGVVVLAHPIRGSRRTMLDRARLFHDAGYATLLIDLRAHGESTGDAITMDHLEREDVRAAVEFARECHPEQPIAVVGWSLGGAAALMASPLDIDALILKEVYPTIEEAVANRTRMRVGPLGPLAATILLTQLEPRLGTTVAELRPIDKIAAAGCPVLVLAGGEDLHTTREQSDALFAAACDPKQCVIFDGAPHVDLMKLPRRQHAPHA
jgi:alpha-beta hydrolase superfamily lysophospholipase